MIDEKCWFDDSTESSRLVKSDTACYYHALLRNKSPSMLTFIVFLDYVVYSLAAEPEWQLFKSSQDTPEKG